MTNESKIPAGWTQANLEDLVLNPKQDFVDGPFGSNLKSSEYVDRGIPVLKIQNIKANRFVRKQLSYVTPEKAAELARHSFASGDLIITKLGEPLGLCCAVPSDLKEGVIVADLMRLRPSKLVVSTAFLQHAINSAVVQSQFKKITKGTTRQRVNLSIVRGIRIQLPPLREQQRIVAKIEELFSELDKGIENLKLARAQLAVYRQSLLKHAFEGKLTADWRAAHADKLESSEQLLDGIRAKCRDSEFTEMRQSDFDGLPELPPCWAYTYLANTGELNRGKSKHRPRNDPMLFGGPYPFIQTGEVKAAAGVIRTFDKTYSEAGLKQSKLWPKGTLCITIAANIAETAFLGIDACFPDSVVGFSAFHGIVDAEFVDLFIRGARTRIEAYAPATAQKNINLATLEGLVIPIASLSEQNELVARCSAQLSVLDQIQSEIDTNLQKSEALRQSILKKAFAGELVPQDPSDEPAAVLLERIRAERAAAATAPKTKIRTPKAAKA